MQRSNTPLRKETGSRSDTTTTQNDAPKASDTHHPCLLDYDSFSNKSLECKNYWLESWTEQHSWCLYEDSSSGLRIALKWKHTRSNGEVLSPTGQRTRLHILETYQLSNKHELVPFRARILELGFIRAESAVIGRLNGCMGMLISIITTLFCGEVSRTHIYLSDSIVTWVKVMNWGLIPTLGSCSNTHTPKQISQSTPYIL